MIDFPDMTAPPTRIASAVAFSVASTNVIKPDKIPRVTLESPWRIGNDAPLEPGNPIYFDVDLGVRACGELLEHLKFQKLKWTSATCKIIEIVTPPKNGKFVRLDNEVFRYPPVHGFIGKDKVEFVVQGDNGRRVFVTLPILLQTFSDAYSDDKQAAIWSYSHIYRYSRGIIQQLG